MSGRRARRRISDKAAGAIRFAASATDLFPRRKIPLWTAFTALLLVAVVPILFQADVPPVAADSTLKCYDGTGNYKPCGTLADASPSRFNGRTTVVPQPPSWTPIARYQQANWATAAVDQPENSTTGALDARHNGRPGKHSTSAIYGRRLIPCFLFTLRRGLTHIASVAARVGQVRAAREHL